MPFLPYKKIVCNSLLMPEEILARLQARISIQHGGKQADSHSRFTGWIKSSSFSIRAAQRYRRAFYPEVHGTLSATSTGSTLTLKISSSSGLITAFLLIALFILPALYAGTGLMGMFASPSLAPAALAIIFYLYIMNRFYEGKRSIRKFFSEITT